MIVGQPTRREIDYALYIQKIIDTDITEGYIYINDNLNTYKSEAVVRLIASYERLSDENLGVKEKSGVLKSMQTREGFLKINLTKLCSFVPPSIVHGSIK